MISDSDITDLVRASIPDATIMVIDKTGTGDHLHVHVTSAQFMGKPPMDRHRMVQRALNVAMQDGRIHALEIKTSAPQV